MNLHTRRDFLRSSVKGLGLVAFSQVAPAFLTRSLAAGAPLPEKDRRILVLVQLGGGNDGLNTVVPYSDDRYYNLRPQLGIAASELHRLDDHLGLHPSCDALARLWKDGQLSIVQNVGYPNPNRSHFRSMEIWETGAQGNETRHTGWLGRYFDHQCSGTPREEGPLGIHLSQELPPTFLSEQPHPVHGIAGRLHNYSEKDARNLLQGLGSIPLEQAPGDYLSHSLLNALVIEERVAKILLNDRPEADYPGGSLATSLKQIAGLIAGGLETRVYFAHLGGFDTHANQSGTHQRLLGELSNALAAFQADLSARGLQDQVLTMTFSEFGRRPAQNGSGGTDHGTAAPLFVMGSKIGASLCGEAPDLGVSEKEDLTFSTDFRSVYATILQHWLECPAEPVLGADFPMLPFLSA